MGRPRRARRRRDPARGGCHLSAPRLILLNGLPGTGKSTLAARYAADRPGVLCLDPDLLRARVEGGAQSARALALDLAATHLATGHDVVLAQLVADPGQVERFAETAERAGAAMVEVELVDSSGAAKERAADDPTDHVRSDLRGPDADRVLDGYRRGLAAVRRARPGMQAVTSHDGDLDRTYAELRQLLDEAGPRPTARPVDLAERLTHVTEHWSPKVVARMDDHEVKVVKVEGEFVWHTHEADELFLVLDGTLVVQLRDGDLTLTPGQLFVVPRGVEHCPRADAQVSAVIIDREGVVNTGSAGTGPLTAAYDDSLLDGAP